MDYPISPAILLIIIIISSFPIISLEFGNEISNNNNSEGRRHLMSFKETAIGTNISYDCSPSGPCVPCSYSEKKDEKYRCSETGYRIPFKCVEIKASSKEVKSNKGKKNRSTLEDTYAAVRPHVMKHNLQRNLLDDLSESKSGLQTYTTYRSCVLSVNEENLSALGFEVVMLGLLIISGSTIYYRKRRAAPPVPGAVRLPTSSRF